MLHIANFSETALDNEDAFKMLFASTAVLIGCKFFESNGKKMVYIKFSSVRDAVKIIVGYHNYVVPCKSAQNKS